MRITNSQQFHNAAADPRNVPNNKAEANWLHAKSVLLGFAQHDVSTQSEQKGMDGDGSGDGDGSD